MQRRTVAINPDLDANSARRLSLQTKHMQTSNMLAPQNSFNGITPPPGSGGVDASTLMSALALNTVAEGEEPPSMSHQLLSERDVLSIRSPVFAAGSRSTLQVAQGGMSQMVNPHALAQSIGKLQMHTSHDDEPVTTTATAAAATTTAIATTSSYPTEPDICIAQVQPYDSDDEMHEMLQLTIDDNDEPVSNVIARLHASTGSPPSAKTHLRHAMPPIRSTLRLVGTSQQAEPTHQPASVSQQAEVPPAPESPEQNKKREEDERLRQLEQEEERQLQQLLELQERIRLRRLQQQEEAAQVQQGHLDRDNQQQQPEEQETKQREEQERKQREEQERTQREEQERQQREEQERTQREEQERQQREEQERTQREEQERTQREEQARQQREEQARQQREEQERTQREEQARQQREEQERTQREEQERTQREEQERTQREEQERTQREEQERTQREEQERKQREEQERTQREEQERKQREEQERKQREEQERKQREEQARQQREEQERTQREEQERKQREEQERTQREEQERTQREEQARQQAIPIPQQPTHSSSEVLSSSPSSLSIVETEHDVISKRLGNAVRAMLRSGAASNIVYDDNPALCALCASLELVLSNGLINSGVFTQTYYWSFVKNIDTYVVPTPCCVSCAL
jgi:hypothetical protein